VFDRGALKEDGLVSWEAHSLLGCQPVCGEPVIRLRRSCVCSRMHDRRTSGCTEVGRSKGNRSEADGLWESEGRIGAMTSENGRGTRIRLSKGGPCRE
jgi:hypothetical protein